MIISDKVDKIFPALLKAKKNIGGATKNSKNPAFRYHYADLNAYLDVIEEPLEENGLILLQPLSEDDGNSYVESRIVHAESGQFIANRIKLLLGKHDMQQLGSAVTYGRRYSLASLLGMKAEDDDGHASTQAKNKRETPDETNKRLERELQEFRKRTQTQIDKQADITELKDVFSKLWVEAKKRGDQNTITWLKDTYEAKKQTLESSNEAKGDIPQ
jgi:hypothetical protein